MSDEASPTAEPSTGGKALPTWFYKALLFLATLFWGFSFFVMKNAVDVVPPAFLLAFRFFTCGVLMTIIFWKRMRAHFDRGHIGSGAIAGILMIVAYLFQTYGIMDTTPGKNAFLTATYCVVVPFIWWAIARRRPTVFNVVAAFGCVLGIGLVSMSATDLAPGSALMSRGDALTLVSALFFAFHIVYVAKVSPGKDIFVLTAWQFLVAGLLSLAVSLATEPSPASIPITGQLIWEVTYLTLFASLAALLIQNVALTRVPPAPASLIISLESVFGVLFSVMFYGETLTIRVVMGFALIFLAILLSEMGGFVAAAIRAKRKSAEPASGEGQESPRP